MDPYLYDPYPLVKMWQIRNPWYYWLKAAIFNFWKQHLYIQLISKKKLMIFSEKLKAQINFSLLKSVKIAKKYSCFFSIMFLLPLTNLTWKERKLALFCTLPLDFIASIKKHLTKYTRKYCTVLVLLNQHCNFAPN